MSTNTRGLMCPHCRSTNVQGPTPAMYESADFRVRCAICLRRFEREAARVEYLRTFPEQNIERPLAGS